MAWWTIIKVIGAELLEPSKRALKSVLDLVSLAQNINALVSTSRSSFFGSLDGKVVAPIQLWDTAERLLCKEALPQACQKIDDGAPALSVCAPVIIAAGCVIAEGLGLKNAQGNPMTPKEIAFVLCFGRPDASTWQKIVVGFETLIPASFTRGRDALAFFQKTSKRLLYQLRMFADNQLQTPPHAHPIGEAFPVGPGNPAVPPMKSGSEETSGDPMEELRKQVKIDLETIEQGGRLLLEEQDRVAEQLFSKIHGNDGQFNQVHLIRGIAGSGKTVLLGALVPRIAAAFESASNRKPNILIYHRNNYLRRPLQEDIRKMFDEHAKLNGGQRIGFSVSHIWDLHKNLVQYCGFSPMKGVLYQIPSAKIALHLIRERERQANPHALYDLIFVDEGQDIYEEEYLLLRKLLDGAERFGMFVFYDDFQNLFKAGAKTVPERLSNLGNLKHHALGVCVRSSKNILDFSLNTALGPECGEKDRDAIEEAIGIGQLLQNGGLVAYSKRSWPVALYSCELCIFKGGRIAVIPAETSAVLHAKIAETLQSFASNEADGLNFPWSCLVLSMNKRLLGEVFHSVEEKLGKDFHLVLRSNVTSINGKWLDKKISNLAVRGTIAFATVHDAKGNDADVVLVIEPDDFGFASSLEKRALFYVASTRAKEHLIVLGVAGANLDTPILKDAVTTAKMLTQ